MNDLWTCPVCKRRFTQKNQRHACGVGDRAEVLRNRPPHIVELYGALEAFVESFGEVEFVARSRYVLFRTQRIFADLSVMSNALRVAIHLPQEVQHSLFVKVARDRKQVTHVARIDDAGGLEAIKPFLREAYDYSVSDAAASQSSRVRAPKRA